jgi:hypothetical protein
MSIEWFYARGASPQQQRGPVAWERLIELAQAGELLPADRVWSTGMSDWSPASTVPGLFSAALADAKTAPTPIAYFTPAATMPQRAERTLRGHARPMGDVNFWPLDDQSVSQWERSLQLRRRVTGASTLYRSLFYLSLIGGITMGMIGAFMLAGPARQRTDAVVMLTAFGFCTGFGALYYFAFRATARSHRWAPLTMLIIYLLFVALNLVFIAVAMLQSSSNSADQIAGVMGGIAGMILPVIFAVVSWRAYAAIPEYLRQPAWCQELIVRAKL